jgi:hypothetical protein
MKQEAERQKSMEQGRAGLSVFKKGKDLTQRTGTETERGPASPPTLRSHERAKNKSSTSSRQL